MERYYFVDEDIINIKMGKINELNIGENVYTIKPKKIHIIGPTDAKRLWMVNHIPLPILKKFIKKHQIEIDELIKSTGITYKKGKCPF
ncbi:hypothetical protein M0R72_12830 [Candidatus Pacearchaeota archaeon]|jgi:hypothetical protein|nr:hypothetical protein [Candidatus Pacearchaeota archaeon]